MKRSFKKTVAFIVALALFIPLFSAPEAMVSAASSDFVYNEWNVYDYSGTEKNLTVPIVSKEILSLSFYAYQKEYSIETMTIEEGYTSVDLYGLNNLKKVTLPSTVTTLYVNNCEKLAEINIPDSVSSLSICLCPLLTEVSIPENSKFVYISECENLTKIDFDKPVKIDPDYDYYTSFYVNSCGIKNISIPDGFTSITLSYCDKLEKVSLTEGKLNYIYASSLPSLKAFNVPASVTGFYPDNISFSGFTSNSKEYTFEDGCMYCGDILKAIDATKTTITVKEGTREIDYLNLSGSSLKTSVINLPDSIEQINDFAFAGGITLAKINIPKNVLTIGAYAFDSASIAKLEIPASVRYIADGAFSNFKGELSVNKENENFKIYKKGLYSIVNWDNEEYISLIYYPSAETSITFMPGTQGIDQSVFTNTSIKNLVIPEGVTSAYFDLYNSKVESLSLPASAYYIENTVLDAPKLKSFSIDPGNEYYSSYKNCFYNSDMTCFKGAPSNLSKIEIFDGCLSAGYYALQLSGYDNNGNIIGPEVTIPKSVLTMGSISVKKAKVYVDSMAAEVISQQNQEEKYWAELYEYDPADYLIDYEFLDSNKDIVNSIYVVDAVTLKTGKKADVYYSLPAGLEAVKKLTKGKNTEVKLTFSSSNKKVAKVNSTTGRIQGVKKGTCTVNVKIKINNGKKTYTKTVKVKVKVK